MASAAVVLVVLFALPPVVLARVGYHFIPSAEWVAQSHRGASVLGWVMLVVGTWLTLIGAKKQNPDGLRAIWLFVIPFGAFLYYWIGYVSVTVGAPLAVQLLSSRQVTLSYEIEDLDRGGGHNCRRPIELKKMPFLFDKLCGFPQGVRDRLSEGEKISVTGRGTLYGFFPEDIAR